MCEVPGIENFVPYLVILMGVDGDGVSSSFICFVEFATSFSGFLVNLVSEFVYLRVIVIIQQKENVTFRFYFMYSKAA